MALEWKILMERRTSSSRKFQLYLFQCTVVRPPPTHQSYSLGHIPLLYLQLEDLISPTRDTQQCTGTPSSDILPLNLNNPAKARRSEVSSPLPIIPSGVSNINHISNISNISNINNNSNISRYYIKSSRCWNISVERLQAQDGNNGGLGTHV